MSTPIVAIGLAAPPYKMTSIDFALYAIRGNARMKNLNQAQDAHISASGGKIGQRGSSDGIVRAAIRDLHNGGEIHLFPPPSRSRFKVTGISVIRAGVSLLQSFVPSNQAYDLISNIANYADLGRGQLIFRYPMYERFFSEKKSNSKIKTPKDVFKAQEEYLDKIGIISRNIDFYSELEKFIPEYDLISEGILPDNLPKFAPLQSTDRRVRRLLADLLPYRSEALVDQTAAIVSFVINDREQRRQETSLKTKKRPKYQPLRGRGPGSGLAAAQWLADEWGDLLAIQGLYQGMLKDPLTGDPKLLGALHNGASKGGMLDHADFHEMMEPFGLFPPFTSLGDIIPTNSEYADLRKLRSALDQIAELQVQKEE